MGRGDPGGAGRGGQHERHEDGRPAAQVVARVGARPAEQQDDEGRAEGAQLERAGERAGLVEAAVRRRQAQGAQRVVGRPQHPGHGEGDPGGEGEHPTAACSRTSRGARTSRTSTATAASAGTSTGARTSQSKVTRLVRGVDAARSRLARSVAVMAPPR